MESSPKINLLTKLVALATVFLCASMVAFSSIRAESADWLNPSAIKTQLGEPVNPASVQFNRQCNNTVFYQLTFVGNDNTPTKKARDVCASYGASAHVGGGLIKPTGAAYGYEIKGPNGSFYTTAPNGKDLIRVANTPFGNGTKYLYFHNTLSGAGTIERDSQSKAMVFRYHNNADVRPYAPMGSSLAVREFAFSENGKWMVVESSGIGFIRINLETKQATQFSRQSFNYNIGVSNLVAFAISNDGMSVISSQNGSFGPYQPFAHDLSSCIPGAAFVMSGNTINGCTEKDIKSSFTNPHPDYYGLYGMRFSDNGRSVKSLLIRRAGNTFSHNSYIFSLDQIGAQERSGYVALGDSFASGEGIKDTYEDGTDVKGVNMCHLSTKSYPYLLKDLYSYDVFNSFACSGAKSNNINNDAQLEEDAPKSNSSGLVLPGTLTQTNLIEAIPEYITVSIGGNDVNFSGKLITCIAPGDCKYAADATARKNVALEIAGTYQTLIDTYDDIKQATDNKSKIYVIGYPLFVDDDQSKTCGKNVLLSHSERVFIKEATRYMNQVIEAAATTAGVHYVDVSNALRGYELCSEAEKSEMAFNGFTGGDDKFSFPTNLSAGSLYTYDMGGIGNESFHPNERGHKLLQQAIVARLGGDPANFQTCLDGKPVCSNSRQPIPEPSSYFASDSSLIGRALNGLAPISFTSPLSRAFLNESAPGKLTRIVMEGFAPGSQVRAEIHSTPTSLGTYTADANGVLDTEITVTASVEPGHHSINLFGTNIANEPVHYYQDVYLTGSEGDLNGNGIADTQESCFFAADSGIDEDEDGIDDACDGEITEPTEPEVVDGGGFTPSPTIGVPVDPKPRQGAGETVAGNEPITVQEPETSDGQIIESPSIAIATTPLSPQNTSGPTESQNDTPTTSAPEAGRPEQPSVLGETAAASARSSQYTATKSQSDRGWLIAGAVIIATIGVVFWRSYRGERSI